MAGGGLLRRFLGRTTSKASRGEVAAPNIGTRLQPYIGELPLHPRQPARYAHAYRDESLALQVYRDTLRDERCQAALDQRLDAVIAKPWEVEPGGEKRRDRQAADALAEQLRAIQFNAVCRQLLHGVWYGYAIGEVIWGRDGNHVVLEDLAVRAPDRFRWSPAGLPLLRTEHNPWGEEIPPAKFVVVARPGEHGDLPHAPGLARWCFWPVWLKRHGLKFWSVALEKYGAPATVGTYPKNASKEEKDKLLELVQAFVGGLGIVIPEDQKVELAATAQRTGGSGGRDFNSFVEYLDRSITTTILGQSSTTDQGPWRGTAEVQKDVRDETVASDARLLDSALNATVARWLTAWNFPGAATPVIRRNVDPPEDLDQRAKREEIVARTTGLRPTQRHVEDVYGGDWEAAPEPPPLPAPGGEPDDEDDGAALATEAIDSGIETLLDGDGWEPLMDPLIEPVLAEAAAALQRGDSLEAFRDDALPQMFASMDDAELIETLRRMGFSARLSGDAGLVDDADDDA